MYSTIYHAHQLKLLLAERAGELLLLEVLEDREVVGHFLVDTLLVPLKMTLHREDVITAVTVEQV